MNLWGYFLFTTLILGWWYVAFVHQEHQEPVNSTQKIAKKESIQEAPFFSYLSTMRRDPIRLALSGDVSLMTKLISEWDVDAQIMESHGVLGVKRLPRRNYVRAHFLGRQLRKSSQPQLKMLRQSTRMSEVIDDMGEAFDLTSPYSRFLPQTYLAATFLLALTEPESIVALPKGIREQSQVFPHKLTEKISLDIDRYNSEALYQAQPQVAFVAHYSHPSTLQALRNQGIKLFTIRSIDTPHDISHTLKRIGNVINRPLISELMTFFMESALIAIDNRLLAATHMMTKHEPPSRVMFLHYHAHYSVPTTKTLTGQLLQRLNDHYYTFTTGTEAQRHEWMISVDQEQIVNFNPDYLIIASSQGEAVRKQILKEPAFASLSAVQQQNIACVDVDVQLSPTQFIVLAYYDIAQALVH